MVTATDSATASSTTDNAVVDEAAVVEEARLPLRKWRYTWLAAGMEWVFMPVVMIPVLVIFTIGIVMMTAGEITGGWYDNAVTTLKYRDIRRQKTTAAVNTSHEDEDSATITEDDDNVKSEVEEERDEDPMTFDGTHHSSNGEERGSAEIITLYGCSDDTVVITGCDGAGEFYPDPYTDLWQGDLVAPEGDQMAVSCWYDGEGFWHCGVGQTDEGFPLPDWKPVIEQHPIFPYSVRLTLSAPLGTKLVNVSPDPQ